MRLGFRRDLTAPDSPAGSAHAMHTLGWLARALPAARARGYYLAAFALLPACQFLAARIALRGLWLCFLLPFCFPTTTPPHPTFPTLPQFLPQVRATWPSVCTGSLLLLHDMVPVIENIYIVVDGGMPLQHFICACNMPMPRQTVTPCVWHLLTQPSNPLAPGTSPWLPPIQCLPTNIVPATRSCCCVFGPPMTATGWQPHEPTHPMPSLAAPITPTPFIPHPTPCLTWCGGLFYCAIPK